MPQAADLHSQRIQAQDDPVELLYERGVTDGLPVVPPTEERVTRMLASTNRDPQEIIGEIGPKLWRASVEKIAINAVMAGCHPSYFPVVLAGVEAMCEEQFCIHGINVTTFSATPMAIINGPIRHEIGVNCGHNALGHGFSANAYHRPGAAVNHHQHWRGQAARDYQGDYGPSRGSTTFCVGENEEDSPWDPLHVGKRLYRRPERGLRSLAVTHPCRSTTTPAANAEQLALSSGWTMAALWNHKNYPLVLR